MKAEASRLGAKATGSELVGLIPKEALLMAADYYGAGGDERARLHAAVSHLGLAQLAPFDLDKKIIEFQL